MDHFTLAPNSNAHDLEPIAMALHELVNKLPITARSRDSPGIRIEEGRVIDWEYSGPALEEAIKENRVIKATPAFGAYKGVPVIVAPIRASDGTAIASLGIVDITGIFDLATLMENQSAIIKQVCGKDPCPLPGEQSSAKR